MTEVVITNRREWEVAISQGLELREKKDNAQWDLGEWAENNTQKFGGQSLKELALGISIPYNSLREYRRVNKTIPKEWRIAHLSFKHHQLAANTINPKEWLDTASSESWSSELMTLKIKEAKGEVVVQKPSIVTCDHCNKYTIKGVSQEELCVCRTSVKINLPIDS